MRLFYSLNGFKNTKRDKNNYFLFLVILGIFLDLFLSGLGFFLRVFELNQIKRLAESLGPPVSPPRWA
jgi:hypothetical protein